jgi:hypothetical protein
MDGSERQDATGSKTLMLSAMMLNSFWQQTRVRFPRLSPAEVEEEMYRALHRMEAAEKRLGRKWWQCLRKHSPPTVC